MMIELIIKDYLDSVLEVSVFFEKPETAPESYVIVEKTGSGKQNHLYSSTFAFKSYAGSLYAAATLNEAVKRAADSLIVLQEIASSKLNTDYIFTDTTTKKHRYQAVYDINHY